MDASLPLGILACLSVALVSGAFSEPVPPPRAFISDSTRYVAIAPTTSSRDSTSSGNGMSPVLSINDVPNDLNDPNNDLRMNSIDVLYREFDTLKLDDKRIGPALRRRYGTNDKTALLHAIAEEFRQATAECIPKTRSRTASERHEITLSNGNKATYLDTPGDGHCAFWTIMYHAKLYKEDEYVDSSHRQSLDAVNKFRAAIKRSLMNVCFVLRDDQIVVDDFWDTVCASDGDCGTGWGNMTDLGRFPMWLLGLRCICYSSPDGATVTLMIDFDGNMCKQGLTSKLCQALKDAPMLYIGENHFCPIVS